MDSAILQRELPLEIGEGQLRRGDALRRLHRRRDGLFAREAWPVHVPALPSRALSGSAPRSLPAKPVRFPEAVREPADDGVLEATGRLPEAAHRWGRRP